MTLHQAKKVIIITEKLISSGVCAIIDKSGATGYTIVPSGGKGSRNVRPTLQQASVVDDFSNIKIEVIVNNIDLGVSIMNQVAEKYFHNYSGISYLETVEILRPEKFFSKETPPSNIEHLK